MVNDKSIDLNLCNLKDKAKVSQLKEKSFD